jgi:hypothetical protein
VLCDTKAVAATAVTLRQMTSGDRVDVPARTNKRMAVYTLLYMDDYYVSLVKQAEKIELFKRCCSPNRSSCYLS